MYVKYSILFILIFGNILLLGQRNNAPRLDGEKATANEYYGYGNFRKALEEFKLLLRQDARNIDYNYKIAQCYLILDEDKTKAIHHLEYVVETNKELIYPIVELGKAYMYAERFDDAMKCFEKYINHPDADEKIINEEVNRYIEMVEVAKELKKNPVNVTFENLGEEINSEYPEYNAFIDEDENVLVYTCRKEDKRTKEYDYDGYAYSDVYMATAKYGKWFKPGGIGRSINTEFKEDVVGLSADGNRVVIYIENWEVVDDLYYTEKSRRSFGKMETFEDPINSGSIENTGCFSKDGNTLFFSSDRKGGYGGFDIYMVRKFPDGTWSEPINLGPDVNTKFDELYPNIQGDNITLYFSSNGHNTMGGFDLFKTTYDIFDNAFSTPQNLGYPINSTYDDYTISFNKSKRHAYISAVRKEGFGNRDIYRITFNDIEQKYSIIKGAFVVNGDTLELKRNNISQLPENVSLNVYKTKSKELVGKYTPNRQNGRVIIILPVGEYTIKPEVNGVEQEKKKFKVLGLGNYQYEINKYIEISNTPPPEEDKEEY